MFLSFSILSFFFLPVPFLPVESVFDTPYNGSFQRGTAALLWVAPATTLTHHYTSCPSHLLLSGPFLSGWRIRKSIRFSLDFRVLGSQFVFLPWLSCLGFLWVRVSFRPLFRFFCRGLLLETSSFFPGVFLEMFRQCIVFYYEFPIFCSVLRRFTWPCLSGTTTFSSPFRVCSPMTRVHGLATSDVLENLHSFRRFFVLSSQTHH